jgi:peroxiredoxin
MPDPSLTLQAILDAKQADWASKAPKETQQLFQAGIQAAINEGVLDRAKNVGDTAPDFTLQNALGQDVSLSEYLAKGPVVLTWYRGGWCPYCNLTLARLQQELPHFQAAGASLLALTPELPDKSLSTREKHGLSFEVLSDVNQVVANHYGIVFHLTPEVATMFQKGFDLHGYHGNDRDQLPLAATYVIDPQGIIRYAFLDAEYRNRAEPAEILAALAALKA